MATDIIVNDMTDSGKCVSRVCSYKDDKWLDKVICWICWYTAADEMYYDLIPIEIRRYTVLRFCHNYQDKHSIFLSFLLSLSEWFTTHLAFIHDSSSSPDW